MLPRLLALVLAVCAAFAQTPTVDQLLSVPFPSGLTVAPVGAQAAWVVNAKGTRNIWVASAPAWQGRAITQYIGDDGQDITSLVWTPDARNIIYTRGSGANPAGEIPNPAQLVDGAEQAVWMVPAAGGEPRKLGEGTAAATAGSRIVWVNKGAVWHPDGGKAARLFATRGRAGDLVFSPDGARLAFTSRRGSYSFIGVYDFESKALRYLDPGVDEDFSPVWSPDGKQVAFVRVPARALNVNFGPDREGQPWSVRTADVITGEAREAWRAGQGRGSVFRAIVAQTQIFWTVDGHIVFPWEADGWTHLYAVPAKGGRARLLTPGSFEVEYVALGPGGREVIYSSNQDDIDRRHIWRVTTEGAPSAVTKGMDIEQSPLVTADGSAVAMLRSGARRPLHPAVLAGGEVHELVPPAEVPGLVEPQAIAVSATDGMQIPAQLFVPHGAGRKPAVIFLHGGSRRQMLLGFHYSPYYHATYALNQYLASRGYIVLSLNYRSGIGYGMEFREALRYGATGASEFQDVLGAGLYLRGRSDVDPKRIGLWGGSYGGYLTAMGLSRASDLFAAGVDIHGVHDWNVVIRNFDRSYDPARRADAARVAFESSPMSSVKGWRSPVLLIHGDDDRNVPFSETVTLAEALRAQGVTFEQVIFPDEVHSFLRHESWVRAFEAAAAFFDKHLGR
jgi:dipeptidyl aminopeptidase/acylaminoacyl peptidase